MSDPEDQSQWQKEDVISRGYKHDPEFLALVENTRPVRDLDVGAYDALVVAGGQGPMFTFEAATDLQEKFVAFYETGKVTAALCHGTADPRLRHPLHRRAAGEGQDRHGLPERRGGPGRPDDVGRRRAAGRAAHHAVAHRGLAAGAGRQLHPGRRVPLVRHPRRQPGHRPAELLRRAKWPRRSSRRSADEGRGRRRRAHRRQRRPAARRVPATTVAVCFARDQAALRARAEAIGASAAAPAEAVGDADVVVLSVPWDAIGSRAGAMRARWRARSSSTPPTSTAPGPSRRPGRRRRRSTPRGCRARATPSPSTRSRRPSRRRSRTASRGWCSGCAATTRRPRQIVATLIRDAGYEPVDLGGVDDCAVMEAPRRAGAVYGEEYRLAEAERVVEALRAGRPIPSAPRYQAKSPEAP